MITEISTKSVVLELSNGREVELDEIVDEENIYSIEIWDCETNRVIGYLDGVLPNTESENFNPEFLIKRVEQVIYK